MDLVASVYALPPSEAGKLQDARHVLSKVTDDHDDAGDCLVHCTSDLGIQPGGDRKWLEWRVHHEKAFRQGKAAEMRLSSAIWEAQHAVRIHCLCQAQSPNREERMREAQIPRTAIEDVDTALVVPFTGCSTPSSPRSRSCATPSKTLLRDAR
ncbi:hypothetical protein E2562_036568 [Oryza meyeriana var. granulata]|uniref:Uncharacterized protein n=1 Tax=Oryza meyeriana var. granulata TaxID=110450 RepID=A0A6G1EDH0_9ORYZ|nr:hypothetical protein E2562_036568 [Oryza meyeriana var. granulata]